MDNCLKPTFFWDSNHPDIIAFAHKHTQDCHTDQERAIALYLAVRDGLIYDPYLTDLLPQNARASVALQRGRGHCIAKGQVLAAAARAVGIPSKMGFANVRNHLATEKFIQILKTDIFAFHGYVCLFLDGKWVKATPAFNRTLCEKFGVEPLDFDGKIDSLFQEFDSQKRRYMEYICYHGEFDDMPFERFITEMNKIYPHLVEYWTSEAQKEQILI